jgi:hypothetical protein
MDEIDVGMLRLDWIMERGVVEMEMGVGLEWLGVDVEELWGVCVGGLGWRKAWKLGRMGTEWIG